MSDRVASDDDVTLYPAATRSPSPACSVCIANYNGAMLLDDCLSSVFQQQGGHDIEVIVHDDASSDDSVALLRARYPHVELLASGSNVGFCIGNNRMVEHARGEYILLLNNDAALWPDALQTLLDATRVRRAPAILTLPQYDWDSGELVDRGCLLDLFYNPVPNLDQEPTDVAYVIGACMFLPRALWTELGGFPEWIGSLAEDMYLCCIARLRGLPVQAANGSGYRHRQGATFGGNRADKAGLRSTYRRRALSERNKTAVMVICTPTAWIWPLLALHFCMLAVEGALLSLLRLDARVWREIYGPAVAFIVREAGALRARRHQVQRTRRITLRVWLRAFVWMPRKLALLLRHGVPSVR